MTLTVSLPDDAGTVVNTASVSSSVGDPTPANDSASAVVQTFQIVPALGGWMLALRGLAVLLLGAMAVEEMGSVWVSGVNVVIVVC